MIDCTTKKGHNSLDIYLVVVVTSVDVDEQITGSEVIIRVAVRALVS